jgi:hypothetical protein
MKPRPKTIAEVKAVIREAVAAMARARRAGDLDALRRAAERKRRAERRGGQLLGRDHPEVNRHVAGRWRCYAQMPPDVFEKKLAYCVKRQQIGKPDSGVKTVISEWTADELGFPTRTVRTADGPEPD